MKYYLETVENVLKEKNTSDTGLKKAEVEKRLAEVGPNKLVEKEKESIVKKFVKEICEPMTIVLIIAAIIYRDNAMVSGILGIIEFNPATIIGNVLLLIASYMLFTGASTFVGSLMPTARDASLYIGVVMIGMVLPLMFFGEMVSPEPSMMVYFLSYFPLSSPIAMMPTLMT